MGVIVGVLEEAELRYHGPYSAMYTLQGNDKVLLVILFELFNPTKSPKAKLDSI